MPHKPEGKTMTQVPWPELPFPIAPKKLQPGNDGFAGAPPVGASEGAASTALPVPMASAETTASKQRGRPFLPGQSGNPSGRPKGAKNKLTDLFLSAVADDFAEHGKEALARIRQEDPATYLKIVSAFVPRELVMKREEDYGIDFAAVTYEELNEIINVEIKRSQFIKAIQLIK